MGKYYPGTLDEDEYVERSLKRRKRLAESAITPTDSQIYGVQTFEFVDITDEEIEKMFEEEE